jgi:hypothetical protein
MVSGKLAFNETANTTKLDGVEKVKLYAWFLSLNAESFGYCGAYK